jgi:small conductance mechanosensitive channel
MKIEFGSIKKKLIKLAISLVALLVLLTLSSITNLSLSFQEFMGEVKLSIGQLFSLAIMVIAVLTAKQIVALILGVCNFESHRAKTVVTIVQSVLQYVAWLVIICWGLAILGVDIGTIVASVGVLALIVGFGAESLIADIVTGLFMLIENQYNVGDIIEVNGYRGTVKAIGIRTTSVEDTSGNIKIINNSSMVNILNRSDNNSIAVADFAIPYDTDLRKLEEKIPEILQGIYDDHTDMMEAVPRYVGVQALGTSEIVLRFVADVREKDIFSAARVMNHDLLLAFRDVGVECPFPQMDVHLDK